MGLEPEMDPHSSTRENTVMSPKRAVMGKRLPDPLSSERAHFVAQLQVQVNLKHQEPRIPPEHLSTKLEHKEEGVQAGRQQSRYPDGDTRMGQGRDQQRRDEERIRVALLADQIEGKETNKDRQPHRSNDSEETQDSAKSQAGKRPGCKRAEPARMPCATRMRKSIVSETVLKLSSW